jgi:L-ascorbate metabolism protein UlaG (beta-lactamase superfamily)
VKLGGKKLLHVGDADTSAEIFGAFDLDEQNIDVAFLPSWFLISDAGAAIVRNHIKPKHIVAVHLGPHEPARTSERIRERFPDAVTFTALLEKRYY